MLYLESILDYSRMGWTCNFRGRPQKFFFITVSMINFPIFPTLKIITYIKKTNKMNPIIIDYDYIMCCAVPHRGSDYLYYYFESYINVTLGEYEILVCCNYYTLLCELWEGLDIYVKDFYHIFSVGIFFFFTFEIIKCLGWPPKVFLQKSAYKEGKCFMLHFCFNSL